MTSEPHAEADRPTRPMRWAEWAMLTVAAIFWAMHLVHLRADFPNDSFWRDWAKYTDEGWYGSAAVRLYQLGHWNLPGDFNPGAALPVWPALEALLFRFTGVSLVAARALTVVIFGMILMASYRLMRQAEGLSGSLAPAGAVLLLAVSPFFFVFSRLAILEPLLVLLMLAALSTAAAAGRSGDPNHPAATVGLGLLLPAMVLTKTTAVFLFPSVLWVVWSATGYRWRPFARTAAIAGSIAAVVWGSYYGLLVRPHYLLDYNYLFSANRYTGISAENLAATFAQVLTAGVWMGKVLYALAWIAAIGAAVRLAGRGGRGPDSGLTIALLLWVLGYAGFVTYHANPQPRYYIVLALPLTLLVAQVFSKLLQAGAATWRDTPRDGVPAGATTDRWLVRICGAAAATALAFVAMHGAMQTVAFVLHPEYTWVDAATRIRQAIDAESLRDPAHPRTVLSISGADLSLMTGLPSLCDDFGTMTLERRIATYPPGWFATWNEVEDDKMEALAPTYRLVRILAVPAFDDTDRNLILLYRLDRAQPPRP